MQKSSYEEMLEMQRSVKTVVELSKQRVYEKSVLETCKDRSIRFNEVDFKKRSNISESLKLELLRKTDEKMQLEDKSLFLYFTGGLVKLTKDFPGIDAFLLITFMLIDEIEALLFG